MAHLKSKSDALLDPFQSDLYQTPASQLLAGTAAVEEAGRFWTHRCKAYASYFDKLARCANFTDVARLQTTFWADTQRDYLNQGATLISSATLTGLPAFARDAAPLRPPIAAKPAEQKAH